MTKSRLKRIILAALLFGFSAGVLTALGIGSLSASFTRERLRICEVSRDTISLQARAFALDVLAATPHIQPVTTRADMRAFEEDSH